MIKYTDFDYSDLSKYNNKFLRKIILHQKDIINRIEEIVLDKEIVDDEKPEKIYLYLMNEKYGILWEE